uniref:Uncharacterized protein n=1 Tax=viral metagenome TaxID=1070528 RepID=A0A6H1ZX21_9ZZZZ
MINFTLEELMVMASRKAEEADLKVNAVNGHLTIFKFTTHWKIYPGTPDLDGGKGRKEIRELQGFDTLEEALKDYILRD